MKAKIDRIMKERDTLKYLIGKISTQIEETPESTPAYVMDKLERHLYQLFQNELLFNKTTNNGYSTNAAEFESLNVWNRHAAIAICKEFYKKHKKDFESLK